MTAPQFCATEQTMPLLLRSSGTWFCMSPCIYMYHQHSLSQHSRLALRYDLRNIIIRYHAQWSSDVESAWHPWLSMLISRLFDKLGHSRYCKRYISIRADRGILQMTNGSAIRAVIRRIAVSWKLKVTFIVVRESQAVNMPKSQHYSRIAAPRQNQRAANVQNLESQVMPCDI